MVRILWALCGCFVIAAAGCRATEKVAVPPRVDLETYQTVGMINFTSNWNRDLEQFGTQKFLQSLQSAQPGTRVVELGSEDTVLATVGHNRMSRQALNAIRDEYGVDAIIVGQMEFEEAKPDVKFSTSDPFKTVNARADVEASLRARMIETDTGATFWTRSATDRATVAHANWSEDGPGTFGVTDTQAVYGGLVEQLVYRVTDDFRVHYERRVVQTASANP